MRQKRIHCMTRGFNAKFRVFEGAYPVTLDFGFTCWRAAFDIPPHDWLRGAAIARERGATARPTSLDPPQTVVETPADST